MCEKINNGGDKNELFRLKNSLGISASLAQVITEFPRSDEAKAIEKISHGRIILRPDGKIDFPYIALRGAAILHSDEPTSFARGIVQGEYEDSEEVIGVKGRKGISGITYMTGRKTMQVLEDQNLQFLAYEDSHERINEFLEELGTTSREQAYAISVLFPGVMGYCNPVSRVRARRLTDTYFRLGLTPVNHFLTTKVISLGTQGVHQHDKAGSFFMPFLAFEKC